MENKNLIWIIIGCTVPLLLIFFAPVLGLGNNLSLLIFILAMFACHLFMPHGHRGHQHNYSPSKELRDEQIKHQKI